MNSARLIGLRIWLLAAAAAPISLPALAQGGIGVSTSVADIRFDDGWRVQLHVAVTSTLTAAPRALALQIGVPEGFTLAGLLGGPQDPQSIHGPAEGAIECAWVSIPTFPIAFDLLLHAPQDAGGPHEIGTDALYRLDGPERRSNQHTLSFRLLPAGGPYHSADYNPADWKISISELLRAIQFYNSDGLHCEALSEDGYAPGFVDSHSCRKHDGDTNGNWQISLSELLRMIQFYNSGGYRREPGLSEDGFAPLNGEESGIIGDLDVTPQLVRGGGEVNLEFTVYPRPLFVPEVSLSLNGGTPLGFGVFVGEFDYRYRYTYAVPADIDGWVSVTVSTPEAGIFDRPITWETAFEVDNTPPALSLRGPAWGKPAWTVDYTGADIVTLNSADIIVESTGTAAAALAEILYDEAHRNWTITLDDLSGAGTLAIRLADGTARDAAGNSAPGTAPSAPFEFTENYHHCGAFCPGPSDPTLGIVMTAGSGQYTAGARLTLEFEVAKAQSNAVTALGMWIALPAGWTFLRTGGNAPPDFASPTPRHTVEAFWLEVPQWPASFTIDVAVPAIASGDQVVQAQAIYRAGGPGLTSDVASLSVQFVRYHSLDYHPADWVISLDELLRAVQFRNTSDGFSCETGSEDGFAAGDGDRTCAAHDLDYNLQDWRIGDSELLRAVQFYNMDGYHLDPDGEDGFAPGQL